MNLKKIFAGGLILTNLVMPLYSQNYHTASSDKKESGLEQKVESKWFNGGDMRDKISEKTPFEIYVFEYDNKTSASKKINARLNDNYLKKWVKDTNKYLSYLSDGKFQLDLKEIKRIPLNYLEINDCAGKIPEPDGKSFKMLVHPSKTNGGYYCGDGLFWILPDFIQLDNRKKYYDPVAVHEMFHGILGVGHSESKESLVDDASMIGLAKEEADYLNWKYKKAIDVHPLRQIKIIESTKTYTKTYRD